MSSMELTLDLTPNDSKLRSDPVARLALTLAKELWMLRDRQHVLEDALARKGVDVRELIERAAPQGAAAEAIAADRKRFVGEVLAALQPPGDRVS
ncbi:MAG: hypothetical protein U1F18_07690 [Steroidobacteraceae bacterium]